jgi:hypothetical protein
MTDDQIKRIVILLPVYSDDANYAYEIRLARAVLAAAHKTEVRRRRDDDETSACASPPPCV